MRVDSGKLYEMCWEVASQIINSSLTPYCHVVASQNSLFISLIDTEIIVSNCNNR